MKSYLALPLSPEFLLVAEPKRRPSFLWFAAIQGVECKERLAHLTPQGCFIATVDGWITRTGGRSSIGAGRGRPL